MGVLEDSLITLKNGNIKKVNDIQQREKILSCDIEGLFSMASNSNTLTWSEENPIITKNLTVVTHKWRESVSNYRLINNKLKISSDGLVLYKNDENITSWGYSKSMRKGYYLFNDKYEFEEIKSIKRIREGTEMVCLSVSPNQYYFANGYLIHNTYLCDACDTCKILPTLWQWYGPHISNSSNPLISTTYGHSYTQAQAYAISLNLNAKKITSSSDHTWSYLSSTRQIIPWNYFPRQLNLVYGSSTAVSGSEHAYYVMKYWDSNLPVPTVVNVDGLYNRGPGWVSWIGSKTQSTAASSAYGDALGEAQQLITDKYAVPLDPWYHGGYNGQGTLDLYARYVYTGTTGASILYTSDGGTSWSEVPAVLTTEATGGYITINENTMGGQGYSNIYIIYKYPLPTLTGSLNFNTMWEFENAPLYDFSSHTFTNCNSVGRSGPNVTQMRAAYDTATVTTGGWWHNDQYFNSAVDGIQAWKCPFSGIYKVTAIGAAGGDYIDQSVNPRPRGYGGHGGKVGFHFKLKGGHWYWILVGQKGTDGTEALGNAGAGGGGATFFAKVPRHSNGTFPTTPSANDNITSAAILMIAGGGGGASGNVSSAPEGGGGWWDHNTPATYWQPGPPQYASNFAAGQGGGGSSANGYLAGGGGTFIHNGVVNHSAAINRRGQAFVNGGQGGIGSDYTPFTHGGYGGGGAGSYHAAGGGGGSNGGDCSIPYNVSGGGGGCMIRPNYDYGSGSEGIGSFPQNYVIAVPGNTSDSFSGEHGSLEIELLGPSIYTFTNHTFTNCGKIGRHGPTLSECTSSYGGSGNWWNNTDYFNVTGATDVNGIQVWTVPRTAEYTITAKGACESTAPTAGAYGLGAVVVGRFKLIKGEKYMILVGQMGTEGNGNDDWYASGGGGGTFMVAGDNYTNITNEPLIIAGGGGGSTVASPNAEGGDGAAVSSSLTHGGNWGTTSEGSSNGGGGGGGLISNGVNVGSWVGISFINGGAGGNGSTLNANGTSSGSHGGFGGGGAGGGGPGGGGGGVYGGHFATSGVGSPAYWLPGTATYTRGGHGGGSHARGGASADNRAVVAASFSTSNNNTHGSLQIHLLAADAAGPLDSTFLDRLPLGAPAKFGPPSVTATPSALYGFSSHTFTNCTATGYYGPTLAQCKASYGATGFWQDSNFFGSVGAGGSGGGLSYGIQLWRVPETGQYDIDLYGAEGGSGFPHSGYALTSGGTGARIKGRFSLIKSDYYWIVVGQKGVSSDNQQNGGGGGGGTYFVKVPQNNVDFNSVKNIITSSDLLIVAGGGGGASRTATGGHGQSANGCGADSTNYLTNGDGGVGGASYNSGGGGGFLGDAGPGAHIGGQRGRGFKTVGSLGGVGPVAGVGHGGWGAGMHGGFGGGGASAYHSGGGGGGAKGGDGPTPSWASNPNGKAGTSYNVGTSTDCADQSRYGHGQLIITAVVTVAAPIVNPAELLSEAVSVVSYNGL